MKFIAGALVDLMNVLLLEGRPLKQFEISEGDIFCSIEGKPAVTCCIMRQICRCFKNVLPRREYPSVCSSAQILPCPHSQVCIHRTRRPLLRKGFPPFFETPFAVSVSISIHDHAAHLHSVVMLCHEMKYVKVEYIIHIPENAKRNARLLARGGIVLGKEGKDSTVLKREGEW
jgi:hypothetical protein